MFFSPAKKYYLYRWDVVVSVQWNNNDVIHAQRDNDSNDIIIDGKPAERSYWK